MLDLDSKSQDNFKVHYVQINFTIKSSSLANCTSEFKDL